MLPFPTRRGSLRTRATRCLAGVLALGLLAPSFGAPMVSYADEADQADPRSFSQTGYSVTRDAFWDFFQKRGGVRTFGYPVSNQFQFLGCPTQFFQRLIIKQCGNGGVQELNLLDAGLLPYDRMNGSTFPSADPSLAVQAPTPNDPAYATKAIEFVRQNAPDTFEGDQVNFFQTFQNTVSFDDAFPDGNGDAGLLPLMDLELWGLPTSKPLRDPTNHEFVYLRFQRGIMHYDRTTGLTQGLLLADYLKAIITGTNVPPDLDAQARTSPLYHSAAGRPPAGTDYAGAFKDVAGNLAFAPLPAALPPVNVPITSTSLPVASPEYGLSMFLWGNPTTTGRDLKLATDAGFHWQKTLFQWRQIEGAGKGQFDWREADRVVQASNASGVKIIARLDFEPMWARADHANNGPPDNYQDYWDFVSAFVSRYKTGSTVGHVDAIEVWNEVNLSREWGGDNNCDPATTRSPISAQQAGDYVRLLTGAYRAAKTADPSVTVITAGLSPTGVRNACAQDDVQYMQWLFDAGLKGGVNYDVLGAHGNTQAPCVSCAFNSLPAFQDPSFYFRRIEQLRDVQVRAGDSAKQIWLLEFGWTADTIHPNYSWFAVTEDQKAQNVVQAFQYAKQNWAPWIGVMTLWTFSDPTWPQDREEYWWAITNPDGTPRPAYTAVLNARKTGILN